jgi:hypothetical protein
MPERGRTAKQFRLLAEQIGEPESAARMIAQAKKLERRSTKEPGQALPRLFRAIFKHGQKTDR